MTTSIVVTFVTAVATGLALGLAIAHRERGHRQRVAQLFDRLAQLEVLVAQAGRHPVLSVASEGPSAVEKAGKLEQIPVRGRFSTLISSLFRRSEVPVPEPVRLDVRAVRYLREHLDRRLTPAQLATELNVSLRTLQRKVNASLGCSPRDLIIAVKMHEAKRMLTDNDQLIATVAQAVGFEDASYFTKRFQAYYGFLPSRLSEKQ